MILLILQMLSSNGQVSTQKAGRQATKCRQVQAKIGAEYSKLRLWPVQAHALIGESPKINNGTAFIQGDSHKSCGMLNLTQTCRELPSNVSPSTCRKLPIHHQQPSRYSYRRPQQPPDVNILNNYYQPD